MPTGLSLFESIMLGAAGSQVASSLFGSKSETPPAPAVIKPTEMPDPLAQQAAGRRKASIMASQQMTAASTILTGSDTKLGG